MERKCNHLNKTYTYSMIKSKRDTENKNGNVDYKIQNT